MNDGIPKELERRLVIATLAAGITVTIVSQAEAADTAMAGDAIVFSLRYDSRIPEISKQRSSHG
jgi:hypothetical protein